MGSAGPFASYPEPDDIAVIGLACRFSGGVTDAPKLWDLLYNRRSGYSKVPSSRFNADAFYHASGDKLHALRNNGGHFLQSDVAEFDAPFFSITSNEAKAIDPAARMLLEVTYEAFENAGIAVENLVGSDTSCYVGCFTRDFHEMQMRDAETSATHAGTGTGFSLLSNRISWFFDLRGPSLTLDTACSSSLVGLHFACQGLRSGESKIAVVSGANLVLSPDLSIWLSNLGMLSKEGLSRTFAEGTSGYGRGEGIATIVLKTVADAIHDGDHIRAVIRGTGVNQDGHTKGITVPNSEAQANLIRSTYHSAGLELGDTGYFEAHGTGTAVGDPRELAAVAQTVASAQGSNQLYVGSVKSNIGHTEGAAGLAGMIKGILMLEEETILPNIHFERPNQRIPFNDWNIHVPTLPVPWPAHSRKRVSVNSFGYGGTNAHVIIDSATEYLSAIGIDYTVRMKAPTQQRVFLFSAQSQSALERMQKIYCSHLETCLSKTEQQQQTGVAEYLERLAFTLSERRSQLDWKAYAVGSSMEELKESILTPTFRPTHITSTPRLVFVFTGQGAQWARMGIQLLQYASFRDSVVAADQYLKEELGCEWSVVEQLQQDEFTSRISFAEFSQPLCSVLQVALVDLLASWNVKPAGVVGHSSGEIGAAYAYGAITAQNAWTIAYFRGKLCSGLSRKSGVRGSMLAVGCSPDAAEEYVGAVTKGRLAVACVNSPESVTVSGDEPAIDEMLETLTAKSMFVRKLKVENAYHSHHMEPIAEQYLAAISHIEPTTPAAVADQPVMVSSVTGEIIQHSELGPAYWVKNLVSPVLFSDAASTLLTSTKRKRRARSAHPETNFLLEVGPHAALQGPLRQILSVLEDQGVKDVTYRSVLSRNGDACVCAVDAAGALFTHGVPVSISDVNGVHFRPQPLVDLPPYPWNRALKYWSESRLSKKYRMRKHGGHDLLGAPVIGFDEGTNLRWRNFLRLKDNPWMRDHMISSSVIYPAAGIIVMPVEAIRQIADNDREIESIQLSNVQVAKAIVVPDTQYGLESILHMHKQGVGQDGTSTGWYEFTVHTCAEDEEPVQNASGLIRVRYARARDGPEARWHREKNVVSEALKKEYDLCGKKCTNYIEPRAFYEETERLGLDYGPGFQGITSIANGSGNQCHWAVSVPGTKTLMPAQVQSEHLIHPSTLDVFFQSLFAALGDGNGFELDKAALPVSFDSITLAAAMPSEADSQFCGFSRARKEGKDILVADVFAWSEEEDVPRVSVSGMRCKELPGGGRSTDGLKAGDDEIGLPCGMPVSKPDFDLCNRTEMARYLRSKSDWDDFIQPAKRGTEHEQLSTAEEGVCKLVDLLAHKNPQLAVLQLGGSSSTLLSSMLAVLAPSSVDTGRFTQLTVVDTDVDELKVAEARHEAWKGKVRFVSLQMKLGTTAEQGLDNDSFDLIVVSPEQAVHAREDGYVKILMALLREQGKLIVMESQQQKMTNIVWGDSCGSVSSPPMRRRPRSGIHSISPFVGRQRRSSPSSLGPTAFEISFGDDETCCHESLSILTKPPPEEELTESEIVYVLQPPDPSTETNELCRQVVRKLVATGSSAEIVSWPPPKVQLLEGKAVLCLLEFERPILMDIAAQDFDTLRNIVLHSSSFLWVSRGMSPAVEMATGYLRSVSSENPNLQLRYLLVRDSETFSAHEVASKIVKVARSTNAEREYKLVNDQLCIDRFIPDHDASRMLLRDDHPRQRETMVLEDVKASLRLVREITNKGSSFIFAPNDEAPLLADEVEVAVKASSISVKATAQNGQQAVKDFSGIIKAVGKRCSRLRVGDAVFGYCMSEYGTGCRTKEILCHKLPIGVAFEEAAAWPTNFATAYRSIRGHRPLREGQSVLIQAAASAVGQAALQLAKCCKATIYATARSAEDSRLVEDLGVDSKRILDDTDPDLSLAATTTTSGRGFDMVLITANTDDRLQQLWKCLAPNAVLFQLDGGDTSSRPAIDTQPFEVGCSFSGIDIENLIKHDTGTAADMLERLANLMADRVLQPINPVVSFSLESVADAFGFVEKRRDFGQVILTFRPKDAITVLPSARNPLVLSPYSTYIVAGGLGGLGRSIARSLVEYGARNIVLLSRSGPKSPNAVALVNELGKCNVTTRVYACDVSDRQAMQDVMAQCAAKMPPIKGVIQSAAVLEDSLYETMTHEQWCRSIRPKVHGSMLLHELLPKDMDFFVMLSSISGLIGNRGQANYAASNTFKDALAHWRRDQGLPAVAIDLGLMVGIGMIAERGGFTTIRKSDAAELNVKDFRAILRAAISGYYGASPIGAQLVVGVPSGGMLKQANLPAPYYFEDPRFSVWKTFDLDQVVVGDSTDSSAAGDYLETDLARCTSQPEAARTISNALCANLAQGLQTTIENIDYSKPLHTYGVDSLMAVEIRAWVLQHLKSDITLFEVLSGGSIASLATKIASSSRLVPAGLEPSARRASLEPFGSRRGSF